MATITLAYNIFIGLQSAEAMTAKIQALPIFRGELDMIGAVPVSRTTEVVAPSQLQHKVVIQTTADGDLRFPTDAIKKSTTKDLYRSTLQLLIPARVESIEPVIA